MPPVQATFTRRHLLRLLTAAGLGAPFATRMVADQADTNAMARAGQRFADTIAVGGTYGGDRGKPGFAIPYGAMVPKRLDNLLAAGRCLCVDSPMVEDMRLIATCLITGHAAGAAAALAVQDKCRPRDVDIPKLQKLLRSQGAYLG